MSQVNTILTIDPGSFQSAFVVYDLDQGKILDKGIMPNGALLSLVLDKNWPRAQKLYIEMIASYGMPVGAEVFETCVWIGRFIQAWDGPYQQVYRKDIKLQLCHSARANDANIRARLIDLFGPGRELAIGTKKSPGPLYGVSKDVWAALALAVYVVQRA